jgi:hypothetical protein
MRTIIYTPLSADQLKEKFNRKSLLPGAQSYALISMLHNRKDGKPHTWLLVGVDNDPRYKYIIWEASQVISAGIGAGHYFFPEEQEMWTSHHNLEQILQSISEETFYDVFEFVEWETPIRKQWIERI